MPKDILVATIGTRDLAYHSSSGDWLNIGNDRKVNSETISEAGWVIDELATERHAPDTLASADYRSITDYLLNHHGQYLDRLRPIIIGQLLEDKHQKLKHIYLIATDQREGVPQRGKDTLHTAEIIKQWMIRNYEIDPEAIEVIPQGQSGENPADFESMFRWWKSKWRNINEKSGEFSSILLSIKGGVGQSSEAARVTALIQFAEKVIFYDFQQVEEDNSRGVPSPYQPVDGRGYLWDRRQKEALKLLRWYDYQAVDRLLRPYHRVFEVSMPLDVEGNLDAAIAWNQGRFEHFASRFKPDLNLRNNWWWTAYEAAYLGIIRLEQGNTVEAMFHSFRAVEGLMSEWAIFTYPEHVEFEGLTDKPRLKNPIRQRLDNLLQAAKSDYQNNSHIRQFFDHTRERRNQIFHRLIGLDKPDVFNAWGTRNKESWSNRVLGCLNFISGKSFKSLQEASMMPENHKIIHDKISQYEPSP